MHAQLSGRNASSHSHLTVSSFLFLSSEIDGEGRGVGRGVKGKTKKKEESHGREREKGGTRNPCPLVSTSKTEKKGGGEVFPYFVFVFCLHSPGGRKKEDIFQEGKVCLIVSNNRTV